MYSTNVDRNRHQKNQNVKKNKRKKTTAHKLLIIKSFTDVCIIFILIGRVNSLWHEKKKKIKNAFKHINRKLKQYKNTMKADIQIIAFKLLFEFCESFIFLCLLTFCRRLDSHGRSWFFIP